MGNIPQEILPIFGIHLAIGVVLLFLGFRTKRSFRWLLIFAGGFEVGLVAILFLIALGST